MSSPINNQVSVPSDVEKNISQHSQTTSWNGRAITKVPTSHGDVKITKNQTVGGVSCCCIAVVLVIAGSTMWGVCDDPTKDGCNEAVKDAGKALTGIGLGMMGVICCVASCIGCCVLGLVTGGALNK